MLIDGKPVTGKVRQVRFETGLLIITSDLDRGLVLERTLTPGRESPAFFELWQIRAESPAASSRVEITPLSYSSPLRYRHAEKGVYQYGQPQGDAVVREGNYRIGISCAGAVGQSVTGASGLVCSAGMCYSARKDEDTPIKPDFEQEIAKRADFVRNLFGQLRFECPDPVLEVLFDYSKIRASDSICETKGGPMHAPGGGSYYAAI